MQWRNQFAWQFMILAIDAGNTRIKWGMHDGSGWVSTGNATYLDMVSVAKSWRALATPDRIVISNVAGEKIRSELVVLLGHWHRDPVWIVSRSEECGVTNCYSEPERLGSDRWASLIASHALQLGCCLVVSSGTAMTVDVLLDSGKFLGGIIVPGQQLMMDALSSKTAGVRPLPKGKFTPYANNTTDAVFSGTMQALAGAIMMMHRQVVISQKTEPLCVLSGGDSAVMKSLLDWVPTQIVDNLVLEGLIRIAQK